MGLATKHIMYIFFFFLCTSFVCVFECYTCIYLGEYTWVPLVCVSEHYTCFSACYTFKFIGHFTRDRSHTCNIRLNIYHPLCYSNISRSFLSEPCDGWESQSSRLGGCKFSIKIVQCKLMLQWLTEALALFCYFSNLFVFTFEIIWI